MKRLSHFAADALRATIGRPSTPWKVNLALTYWCQYRCKTCNIWKKQPVDELSTDELLQFIAGNRHFSWADLTGGEIFLRKDIEEIFEAIASDWKRLTLLHFPTNGYLSDRIVRSTSTLASKFRGNIAVTVSLDGDEELNDRIRGVAGGFRHQLETYRRLREIPGVRVILGMTLSRENLGAFEPTLEACRRIVPGLSVRDFHLNVMQLSTHYYGNDASDNLSPDKRLAQRDLHQYRALRGRSWTPSGWLEDRFLSEIDGFLSTGRTPLRCHSLRSSCFIDPWGTVFPCITYSRPVGRLREHSMNLAPIWNSRDARELQTAIWEGDCPQCWTACEAYQSILGNLLAPGRRHRQHQKPEPAVGESVVTIGRHRKGGTAT